MRSKLRSRLPIVLSATALIVAVLGWSTPAIAHGVRHALFAHNAGKVDGKNAVGSAASLNRAAGKLVATNRTGPNRGKFAKKFIPDSTIAFANVAAESGTPAVTNFGGNGTTSVTVVDNGVGNYTVQFHGNYPGVTATTGITPIGSIVDTDSFNVASLSMDQGAASSTQINVRVFVWSTNTTPNPLEDRDFSILILR